MTKSVLALVVLMLICQSEACKKDFNLNQDMLGHLKELDKLNREAKVNISSPGRLQVPDYKRACLCQGMFLRELRHLLTTVTVAEEHEHILNNLKRNLNVLSENLGANHEDDDRCRTRPPPTRTEVFEQYRKFLLKVNSSRRK